MEYGVHGSHTEKNIRGIQGHTNDLQLRAGVRRRRCQKYLQGIRMSERIKIDIQASSLRQLAALCANCSFYFGNEGGARHIAPSSWSSFICHFYSPSASKSMWLPANSVLAEGISPDDILPPEQQATLPYEERFCINYSPKRYTSN